MSTAAGLSRLRYAGLLSAGALAAGAYPAGALPYGAPPSGGRPMVWQAVGIAAWVVGTVGLVAAWWRVGTRARARDPGLRWLYVTGALWSVPLLLAPPLASRDIYSYACQGALYAAGVDAYTYGPAAGGCSWLDSVAPLWRDTTSPYGPAAVALSAAAVRLAGLVTTDGHAHLLVTLGLLRVLAVGGLALLAWSSTSLARRCGVDPFPAAWLAVLSPLVTVHVLSAAHHDGLLAGLALAGLAVAAARPTAWLPVTASGALLGLAIAIKVTALVALPFAVLLVWRQHRGRAVTGVLGGAAATYAAVTGLTGLGLGWLAALPDTGRVVQWTSVPTGVGMAFGYALRILGMPAAFGAAVAVGRLAGLGVLVTLLVVLWVRAARVAGDTRVVVACCGLALGATAVLSPVFFPWYLVAAVAVLAASLAGQRARWRVAAAVAGLSFLILPDGHGLESRVKVPGAVVDVLLVGALAWHQRRAVGATAGAGKRLIRHVLVVSMTPPRDKVAS